MQILMMVLLVVLPFGTAIICGAITEWAGEFISGYCSLGGLALGIYFFSKSMTLLMTGETCGFYFVGLHRYLTVDAEAS